MEQGLTRIENELKALKSSMPVSGSLVETYCITQRFTKTLANRSTNTYTIKFTPLQGANISGLSTLSIYEENWASGPVTSRYNPYSFASNTSGMQSGDGSISYSSTFSAQFFDGDTFEVRIIASVYGTIPGTLSIAWS